jgi:hypothetical protein
MTDQPRQPVIRELEPDPRTVTGSYQVVRLVRANKYGGRKSDRPLWWVLGYHAGKAVLQVLTVIAIAVLARWLGIAPVWLP